MSFSASAAILGLGLGLLIFYLVRRDQLYVRDATFWLATAAASAFVALRPSVVDAVGVAVGVAYPPALLLALVCGVLTVKSLILDLTLTQLRREVRRLNQRVALLDERD